MWVACMHLRILVCRTPHRRQDQMVLPREICKATRILPAADTQNYTQTDTYSEKPESSAIPQKRQLHQFNAHKNLFRHSDPHDPAHDAVFSVDGDEAFVNAHLPAVPRCGALAAGRFSNRDLELLCRQRNGSRDLDARLISDGLQFSTDVLQFRVVRTG